MSRISRTRWGLSVVALGLVSSCAPACLPTPAGPEPGAVTTTTLQRIGMTTVAYDGAGATAPRIGIIGDSTLASIRWTDAFGPLRRWNYTYDAESCRRTITASCAGADGYAPDNAVAAMRRLSGRLGTVLVVMNGANDPTNRFGEGIDAVIAEARAQGIGAVVWLTIHASPDKNAVLAQRAQQHAGYLRVADWDGYSAPHPEWANADGLHISTAGAPVLAQFLADQVAPILGG